jgi:polysaccharide biosynthesis protein PslH
MTRLRILVLSPDVPFPPIGGGNLRSYHLLRLLAARYEVTLVAFTYGGSQADAPPFPLRVLEVPWELPPLYRDLYSDGAIRAEAASRQLAELTEPSFVSISESPAMEEALDRLHRSERFDLALIEHTVMARFLHVLPPGLPKVLDLHNVHSLMASRVAAAASEDEHESARWEADRTLRFERQVASHCALCLTVSEVEAAAARSLLGIETTQVIPNGVDTASSLRRRDILRCAEIYSLLAR